MRNTKPPSPELALAALLAAAGGWLVTSALAEAARGPPQALEGPGFRPDLNSSPAPELLLLPGIGPARAEQIVSVRESRGPFGALADLRRVRGIGPVTIRRLEGRVTAADPGPRPSGREPPDPPGSGPAAVSR